MIESYYRSNPKRFRIDPSKPLEEQGIRPFDDEVKQEVREYILSRKEQRIETEEFERLKKKYNARFCDQETKEDEGK